MNVTTLMLLLLKMMTLNRWGSKIAPLTYFHNDLILFHVFPYPLFMPATADIFWLPESLKNNGQTDRQIDRQTDKHELQKQGIRNSENAPA